MPRIRKKTSKRGTTNQRGRIKQKVAETRKKRKKETKKNTQWKSKTPKDPGIPNSLPFKDEILAEVAEQRRQAAEQKERRKEEKKTAKAKTNEPAEGASDAESEVQFDGVSGITVGKAKKVLEREKIAQMDVEEEEEELPALISSDLPNLQSVIDSADVVIQVLDARDPLRYRSEHLESLVGSKKMLLVLNKVDTCPRESVEAWASMLRAQHTTVLFRSASSLLPSLVDTPVKGKGKERADDGLGVDAVLACLRLWSKAKSNDEPLVVAVVGVANTGKSSFVNSLLRGLVLPIYKLSTHQDGSTTTTYAQEVILDIDGKQVRVIDTPGLAWQSSTDPEQDVERIRARDILLRSRGKIERLKDPTPVVAEMIADADREDLMLFYNIPAFIEGDANAFLSAVARANGLIKKGGILDLTGASRIVLRDWSTGKFPRYTLPPSATTSTPVSDAALADVYAKDEDVLSSLQARKERRTSAGVVKLKSGALETRKVVLDASWLAEDDEDAEDDAAEDDSDGEEPQDDDEEGEDDDEEDEEDEEEDDDEEEAHASGKRKRAATKITIRPSKKVAFAPEPAGTKKARSAAGAKSKGATLSATKDARGSSKSSVKAKSQKTTAKVLAKKTAAAAPQRVANIRKAPTTTTTASPGEEAYDFKKYF